MKENLLPSFAVDPYFLKYKHYVENSLHKNNFWYLKVGQASDRDGKPVPGISVDIRRKNNIMETEEDIIKHLGQLERRGDYMSCMMIMANQNTELSNMINDSLASGESSFKGWNNTSIGNIARVALRCSDESIKNKALLLLTNYMKWLKNNDVYKYQCIVESLRDGPTIKY